jgi:hypothetical protein
MRSLKQTLLVTATLVAAFAVSTALADHHESQDEKADAPMQAISASKEQASSPPDESARPATPARPPFYRPPAVGRPVRSVGGGSRGPGDGLPLLYALVPNHVAQTSSQQPSLFWFVSGAPSPSAKLQFTLLDEDGVEPVVETAIATPKQAGIYRIRLSELGVRLEPGTEYEWSVSIIVDPNERARDIVAAGWIHAVGRSDDLERRLESEGEGRAIHVYADEGLWYDALTSLGDRIERNPGDPELAEMRSALLGQVGLQDVASGVL